MLLNTMSGQDIQIYFCVWPRDAFHRPSHWANSGAVSQINPRPLPSMPLSIHHSLSPYRSKLFIVTYRLPCLVGLKHT